MTYSEAIQILMRHTANDFIGTGCGIRTAPSDKERKKAKEAIKKLWGKVYDFPCTDSDLRNMGLW